MYKLAWLVILLFTIEFVSAQTHAQEDEAQITAARAASNAAIANHQVAGIVHSLLPDYSIVTGRGQRVVGRDNLTAFWEKTFQDMPGVVYIRTPSQVVISKNDSLAWESGEWKAVHSYSGGGNYAAMWHKRDGVWWIQSELFVSLEK